MEEEIFCFTDADFSIYLDDKIQGETILEGTYVKPNWVIIISHHELPMQSESTVSSKELWILEIDGKEREKTKIRFSKNWGLWNWRVSDWEGEWCEAKMIRFWSQFIIQKTSTRV